MKFIGILSLCLLAGCGSYQSLEQLEAQALISGDWSLVEQREQAIRRREQRDGPECPAGYTSYCETWGDTRCTCIERDEIWTLITY